MNPRKAFLSLLLAAALLVPFVTPVYAQGGTSFMLRPDPDLSSSQNESYFVYGPLAPGAVIEDAVQVINTSGQPLDLLIYPADAATASNGGMAFPTGFGETPTRAGGWIELSTQEVHLQPGEVRSIPFRFVIPENARGEIAAGIVAQPKEASQKEGQFSVTVVQRVAVTLMVVVEGESPLKRSMEIASLDAMNQGNQQQVVATLWNTGDLGLRPRGVLTIQDAKGEQVYQAEVALSYFLAGDQVAYRVAVNPPLPQGEYQVTLRMAYEGGEARRTAMLTLREPDFQGEVIQLQPTPAVSAGGTGYSPLLLLTLGVIIVLLSTLVVLQTIRLRRARRE